MAKVSKLTTQENITKRLIEGFDRQDCNSIYRQMQYVFGEGNGDFLSAATGDNAGTSYPDFPDRTIALREIGKSNRILNVSKIELGRVAGSDISPSFPDVDEITSEIRKQFFRKRATDGEWQESIASAIYDGLQFGMGFIKVGYATNPDTGKQKVHVIHSPRLHTLWDRHARQPSEMRWICFVNYLSPEVATDLYGEEVVQKYTRSLYSVSEGNHIDVVRIFEYYDLGYDSKSDPTCAIIPGELTEEAISIERSDYNILPIAYIMNTLLPGMKRPVGNIFLSQPINEELDEMERMLRQEVQNSATITVYDTTQLNEQDVQNAENGTGSGHIKMETPVAGQPPITRIPPAPIDQTRMVYLQRLDRAFNEASSTTDLDRGNQLSQSKTLGEAEMLVNRSSSGGSWNVRQTLLFYRRLVKAVLICAQDGDTDKTRLDMSGIGDDAPYIVNNGKNSSISKWLEEPSDIIIGEDSITSTATKQQQAQDLSKYLSMIPLLQTGQLDPQWLIKKIVVASGTRNVNEAIIHQSQVQAPQQAQQQAPQMPPQGNPEGIPGGIAPVAPPQASAVFPTTAQGKTIEGM